MNTDVYDRRTKAERKAEDVRNIRGRAMKSALALSAGVALRTVKDIVADAAVIERYLASGAAPKPKAKKTK